MYLLVRFLFHSNFLHNSIESERSNTQNEKENDLRKREMIYKVYSDRAKKKHDLTNKIFVRFLAIDFSAAQKNADRKNLNSLMSENHG